MPDGGKQPFGGGCCVGAQRAVRAGHHQVELGEDVVRVVERAVGQDVDLAAGEHVDAVRVGLGNVADLGGVGPYALDGQPVRLRLRAAVVGERNGVEAAADGFLHHAGDREAAVARRGVAVELGADGGRAHEVRGRGVVEFTVVLAQFRRDPWEPERCVDLFLGACGHGLHAARLRGSLGTGFVGKEPVLVEPLAGLLRAFAQADVVFLAAGEVEEGGAVLRIVHGAEVHLHAVVGADAGLGVAGDEHLGNAGCRAHGGVQRGGVRGACHDVHVADRLLAAAQAPGMGDARDASCRAEVRDERGGDLHGLAEPDAAARGVEECEGFLDALERLGAHAGETGERAIRELGAQRLHAVHAALLPERADALGAQTRDPQEAGHARRDGGEELVMFRHLPGADELLDLLRAAVTDSRDLAQASGVGARECRQVFAGFLERAGHLAVRVHAECVGAGQVQDVGDLVEDARQFQVAAHSGTSGVMRGRAGPWRHARAVPRPAPRRAGTSRGAPIPRWQGARGGSPGGWPPGCRSACSSR